MYKFEVTQSPRTCSNVSCGGGFSDDIFAVWTLGETEFLRFVHTWILWIRVSSSLFHILQRRSIFLMFSFPQTKQEFYLLIIMWRMRSLISSFIPIPATQITLKRHSLRLSTSHQRYLFCAGYSKTTLFAIGRSTRFARTQPTTRCLDWTLLFGHPK